ncbi:MAG: SDR family NAD(P)-dependent oxidoreductase [Hyphomicrobium sp.]
MYMSVIGTNPGNEILRELQGARVLITGLATITGVDVARAFADLQARLIVQTNDLAPELTAVIALLSQSAAEIKLYTDPISTMDTAVRFAQSAQQAYGGLDAVINLQTLTTAEMATISSEDDINALCARKIAPLTHITHVAANRMRLVMSDGMILNVLSAPKPEGARETAILSYMRTALAVMTRGEAEEWAGDGIRINAIGPRALDGMADPTGATLTSEPDIAALALYLASKRGRSLSGHVFDADGIIARAATDG